MKLPVQPLVGQGTLQHIDPIGHVEGRTGLALGQEVAHRTVERASQPHPDAVHGHERVGSVDRAHGVRVSAVHAPTRLFHVHAVQVVHRRVEQVDDATDGALVHGAVPSSSVVQVSAARPLQSSVRPPGHTTRTRDTSGEAPSPTMTRGSFADA
jgi:hypothetical protein